MFLPLYSDPRTVDVASNQNATMSDPMPIAARTENKQQSVNMQLPLGNSNESGQPGVLGENKPSSSQLPVGLELEEVTAIPPTESRLWHQTMVPDLRNHLLRKLVQGIFQTPDPTEMLDTQMDNLVAYARKVEVDIYEKANSRAEYYHLLSEKILKILKPLEE